MKILFTGASSFTGMWFVKELARAGHDVTATFRESLDKYQGIRLERIKIATQFCKPVYECSFGSESFLQLINSSNKWDMLCHHAADVHEYKSPDFNFVAALANNTSHIKEVLNALRHQGCYRLLLTGSVFEQNEGVGSDNLRAVSPYGLSKGLTTDVFRYFAQTMGFKLGKFVIPNPFGPYEELRFTTFLMQAWSTSRTASVSSPAYVRDNIHVSLLAKAYAKFASTLTTEQGFVKINPSGYVESQGAFTMRFAKEMRQRIAMLPCHYDLLEQTEFLEPKVRINMDGLKYQELGWNEEYAWDELADYYKAFVMKNQWKFS